MCSKHVETWNKLIVKYTPVHETATYRCDNTRCCVMQFWPPDDKHMCSKHVEAWNKLVVKCTPVHETTTYMCGDTGGCLMQFWPPDNEHMCSKHVEAWNKLIVKEFFLHKVGLLTYSMVQSPSWAADWLATSQEIPRISRNPKVHYRTHKRTPTVSILGQPNPVYMPTSHLLEIHPNIIG